MFPFKAATLRIRGHVSGHLISTDENIISCFSPFLPQPTPSSYAPQLFADSVCSIGDGFSLCFDINNYCKKMQM